MRSTLFGFLANRFPDITKNIDGNLNTLARDLFKNHIFFNSTSMKSEGIAKTILTYYNQNTGAELGSLLVQGCRRVKEHCTNRRSRFTDVVRKSTTAILINPKNGGGDDENQSNVENTNSKEMDEYNRALNKVKKGV